MYESVITKKIEVGENFPQVVIYLRRNAVDFRLIKLETVLVILLMKLCVGNMRANTRNK